MTVYGKTAGAAALDGARSQGKLYLETLNLVERLHRQLLDVIKDELDRRDEREINSVQALLLFNVGDQELTCGRTAHPRALSRLQRLLQSQEAGRPRLYSSRAIRSGPPLGPGAPDTEGRSRSRHAARIVRAASGLAGGRGQCRRPTIWTASTAVCAGWSVSGSTRCGSGCNRAGLTRPPSHAMIAESSAIGRIP